MYSFTQVCVIQCNNVVETGLKNKCARVTKRVQQDFGKLKGITLYFTYPHNFPELSLKKTQGNLDSEVTTMWNYLQ